MSSLVNYTDLKFGDFLIIHPEYESARVIGQTRSGVLRINYRRQIYTLGRGTKMKFNSGVVMQNLGRRGHFGRRVFIRVERDEYHSYERVRAQSKLETRA